MASYEEKPYLISQCAAFVLNKLANESSTKDGIEASFVINSDDYCFFDGTLDVLLDALIKDELVKKSVNDGKEIYSLCDFVDLPIFSMVNYTPYQLSANYDVKVFNDLEEAGDIDCALIKNKTNYGIYIAKICTKADEPKPEVPELREDPLVRNETKKEKRAHNKERKAEKASKSEKSVVIENPNVEIKEEPKENTAKETVPEPVVDKVVYDKPTGAKELLDSKKSIQEEDALNILGMLGGDEEPPIKAEEPVKTEADASKELLIAQEKLATTVETTETSSAYSEFKTYIAAKEIIFKYSYETMLKDLLPKLPKKASDVEVEEEKADKFISVSSYTELKTKLGKKGYSVKPYLNQNAYSYYADNFYFSNKLSRDTSFVVFFLILIEIFLGFMFLDKFAGKGLLFYIITAICALALPFFFTQKYLFFRYKRKKTDFNFKMSFATAFMIYLNLMVIFVLVSFFTPSLNVTTDEASSMIVPILYPAVLLFNIPLYVCVYAMLYSTKRYHIH